MPRAYKSEKRTAQRAATRRAISTAARDLFVAHGYARTTVRQIAASAGVTHETVFATFGSKAGLLRVVAREASLGDQESVFEGAWIIELQAAADLSTRWQILRNATAAMLVAAQPIDDVVRAAAASDVDIAKLWREMQAERHRDVAKMVDMLIEAQPLRVLRDEAIDLMWALAQTTGVYRALAIERRWPPARAAAAVADLIEQAVLPTS